MGMLYFFAACGENFFWGRRKKMAEGVKFQSNSWEAVFGIPES